MILDFTTTATNRIDIIEQTYRSFTTNLKGVDFKRSTLYINIDPIPTMNKIDFENIKTMCLKYFGNIVANVPEKPNYTQAYKWLFTNATNQFVFNLEDDFALIRQIEITDLLYYFDKYPELYCVALRLYHYHYKSIPTSPQLLHRRYYKSVGLGLDPSINPEIQLRGKKWGLEMPTFRPEYGPKIDTNGRLVVYPEPTGPENVITIDIGRDWIEHSGFKRPDTKEKFLTWEQSNGIR